MSPGETQLPGEHGWYRIALSSIGDGVIVTDGRGRVNFMNPVAEALTGWPEADAVGRPLPDVLRIVNARTRLPAEDPVADALTRGQIVGLAHDTVLISRDGTERPIDDSAAPIRNAAGGLAGAVLVFRDISDRRRTERVAEDAHAYAEGIVETVREPLLVLDASLRVVSANPAFYRIFQVEPAQTEGRFLYELGNRQWDLPRLRELLDRVISGDASFDDFEVDHEFEGVGRRTMLLNARRLAQRDGRAGLILLTAEDVTERRRTAHDLAVSETRYRRLFETAQDGILIVDAETRRAFDANPFLTALLGYTHEELVGKELWEIGLLRDVEASKVAFRELQVKGYTRYEDLPLQTKDGRRIDVEFVSNVYPVDGRSVIQCNIRDVTDRKRAEDALHDAHDELEGRVRERTAELARANASLTAEIEARNRAEVARQDLLRQLGTAQEDERRHFARELHDRMGQHLTALSLGLKSLKDTMPEPSPGRKRLQQLQELTDLLGREVHQLALQLRPTALDDLGLHTALMNYAEEWAARSEVEVDFHSTGLERLRLPPPIETALYRIVQEALTNVLKHARARHVSLILQRSMDQMLAVLEDDGKGFESDGEIPAAGAGGRLGLLGMRERAELIGGTLTVESTPGRGTAIFVRVPLESDGNGDGDGRPR
jgi:PAS domain S-box-containing protein